MDFINTPLIRNFTKCFDDVKICLFKAYITSIYCAHLWCNYSVKTMHNFTVAYNNVFRSLFSLPRHINGVTCSITEALASKNIPSVCDIIVRMGASLDSRLKSSDNPILASFIGADVFRQCPLISIWNPE